MTAYVADTWLRPITITTGVNDVFVLTEDPSVTPTAITITIDAGTYFLHDDTSYHATRKGLLYTIKTLINDGTTAGLGSTTGASANTYSWAVVDPSTSTGLTNNGLKLYATTTTDFEITWTGATTLGAKIFGSILDAPVSDDLSATSGGDEQIIWPYATPHRMCTRDLGSGEASDKVRYPYKDVRYSSPRPADSVAIVWDEGFIRRMSYENVPGVEVHEARAAEAEWAATTGRTTNDINATWWQVWDTLTDGDECIIVHNSTSDLQIDTHSYEVVKLWSDLPWEQFASSTSRGGDYCDITVPVWVNASVSDYDH